jgi:hypothetical protein
MGQTISYQVGPNQTIEWGQAELAKSNWLSRVGRQQIIDTK